MPGLPITVLTSLSCLHQAPAQIPKTQTKVMVSGELLATLPAQIAVIGCTFNPGAPQPCLNIRWTMMSTKVLVQGQALLLMTPPGVGLAPGVCLGPAPQGTPTVKKNQVKVTAL